MKKGLAIAAVLAGAATLAPITVVAGPEGSRPELDLQTCDAEICQFHLNKFCNEVQPPKNNSCSTVTGCDDT